MSLSDLAALGSFFSGLGVLISFVFLYFQLRQVTHQVRQNAKHTEALIFQGGGARASSQLLTMADADLVAAVIIGNGGKPTPEEIRKRQFGLMWQTHYITWDDNFTQHEQGLIDDQTFLRLRGIMTEQLRANPGYVALYLERIGGYAADSPFHRYVREVCGQAASPPATG